MKILKSVLILFSLALFAVGCNPKTASPKVATFKISGMTCAYGCAKTIENKLSKTTGVTKAVVNFDTKTAKVNYDASVITTEKIATTVQETGDGATYKVFDLK